MSSVTPCASPWYADSASGSANRAPEARRKRSCPILTFIISIPSLLFRSKETDSLVQLRSTPRYATLKSAILCVAQKDVALEDQSARVCYTEQCARGGSAREELYPMDDEHERDGSSHYDR